MSYKPFPTCEDMINIQMKKTVPTIQKLNAAYQLEPERVSKAVRIIERDSQLTYAVLFQPGERICTHPRNGIVVYIALAIIADVAHTEQLNGCFDKPSQIEYEQYECTQHHDAWQ
jgi:hypothetical protein